MTGGGEQGGKAAGCRAVVDPGDPALPVAGTGRLSSIRGSTRSRWRATVLILVHVAIVVHATQFFFGGRTLSPVEPSESMYTLELGYVNAGFIFFALALLSTLLFGRFFCGWGCHIVALQDLCAWIMKKLGVRPRPFRSRLLIFVPLVLALYMFVWPTFLRLVFKPDAPAIPPLTNHLMTDAFWATFPGPTFAVLTFLVCGFAAVYFLGAKGFCSYGCPYGGFFGLLDQISPGKILVTDACDQCGHCTATCTSNVRVHEEVKAHGRVVDPGCMKCTDCISVCPKEALYFGFGSPSILKGKAREQRSKRRYDLTPAEDLALVVVCAGATLAFRGLYDGPPLLMSVGLGGITAFLVLKLWRLWRDDSLRLQNLQLKTAGRLRRTGLIFALLAGVWLGFAMHSGFVQWHRNRGRAQLELTEATRADLPGGAFLTRTYSSRHHRAAERAFRHFSMADRWGLFPVGEVKLGLAWTHILRNEPAPAESFIRSAIDLDPQSARQRANLVEFLLWQRRLPEAVEAQQRKIRLDAPTGEDHFLLGQLLAQTGRAPAAIAEYRAGLELQPTAAQARFNLGALLVGSGDYDAAVEQYLACIELSAGAHEARYNLGGLLRRLGRFEEAVEQLTLAARDAPEDAATRIELGLAQASLGRNAEAVASLRRAVELAPDSPEARVHLPGLIEDLEQKTAGQ